MHEKSQINVNGNDILVDKELANIIVLLNKLRYKTSGCCIGEKDYAWIVIQETSEVKMINLIRSLSEYNLSKSIYIKNDINSNDVFMQYRLTTPRVPLETRLKIIKSWESCLEVILNKDIGKKSNISYKTMEDLFDEWHKT